MKFINGLIWALASFSCFSQSIDVLDESRNRTIPIKIYNPVNADKCFVESKCPVVILSAGYGIPHTKYSFLVEQFNERGYLTVAIRHELPNDPPLSTSGNLFKTRSENWIRGANTLEFIRDYLIIDYQNYDFDNLLLVGHSNGGDISSWLGNEGKTYISGIITLDYRRVPLPRNSAIKVLSIRASDFPADKDVLPTVTEQSEYGSCVVKIDASKHNDMWDKGPETLKNRIVSLVKYHLDGVSCKQLKIRNQRHAERSKIVH